MEASQRRRFLAPLVRSGGRRTWQSWPWWFALPLAAAFAGGAFWFAAASSGEPLRPDVGYVVSQPDTCVVRLAPSPGASEAQVEVGTDEPPGGCTAYDVGERLYYDAGAPELAVSRSSGADNDAFLVWTLAAIAVLLVGAAVHDVAYRRHQLVSGKVTSAGPSGARVADRTVRGRPTGADPSGGLGPRRAEPFLTVVDLMAVAVDPDGGDHAAAARLRGLLGGALLLDLLRLGHAELARLQDGARARVVLTGTDQPRDPLLRDALTGVRQHPLEGVDGKGPGGRAALRWLERQDQRRLTAREAVARLAGGGDDVGRVVETRVRQAGTAADRGRLVDELRSVLAGRRAVDDRTGPLLALLEAGRRTGRLVEPTALSLAAGGGPVDPVLRAVTEAVRDQSRPQG